MAFIQQPTNYAEQYARELANAYPYLSYFGEIFASPNSSLYRPVSGRTILVPSMTTSGARAVNRDSINGQFTRNFNTTYEPKIMRMYREWDTIVDPMDVVQTNDVATIANVTKTFNEFQKIPEMDAYAASECVGFASAFGGVDSTALTSDNILSEWDDYLAYMTSQRANRDRVVAYMTPATYKLLKEAAGLTRWVSVDSGIRNVDRNVGKLDGVLIKEVPPDIMLSEYDFTEGFVPAVGASQVNMLFVDPLAVLAPIVYDVSMLTPPTAATKGKTVYYESYYYDVYALNQRQAGFFANMSAPSLGTVTVTSTAGASAGSTSVAYTAASSLLDIYGAPVTGLDVYYTTGNNSAASCTYGSPLPAGGLTWVKCSGTNPIALTSQTANKHCSVAIVNKTTGGVIAAGDTTLNVGA